MVNAVDILSDEARKEYWASLAFRYCEGLSPRLFCQILRYYHNAYTAYEEVTKSRQNLLLAKNDFIKKIPHEIIYQLRNNTWREKALLEWQDAKKSNCEIILWSDYRYPLALKNVVDAPAFFYAKGNVHLLNLPSIAIVGSRKHSQYAEEKTKQISADLAKLDICIVSGMAEGIDCIAHTSALDVGGKSVAVLGCGVDIIYPKSNEKLYENLCANGLVISEFSPFSKPLSHNFPIRNRLVTALSEGVLIAEAKLKSGSLITARLAIEQNKNVYVLKPLHAEQSLGGQKLIDDGAMVIEDSYAIIEDMLPDLTIQYEMLSQKIEKNSKTSEEKQAKKEDIKKLSTEISVEKEEIKPKKREPKNYKAYAILSKPEIDQDLTPLAVDFGQMAHNILQQKASSSLLQKIKRNTQTTAKKLHKQESEKTYISQKAVAEQNSIKKENIVNPNPDNEIVSIIFEKQECTADEILLALHEMGSNKSMQELASDLIMLEIEGYISKFAGARYKIHD